MQPKPEKQQAAKDLYFQTDKSMTEIADILDIDRKTLYLWIKHGKWKEMKTAARQAPALIGQDIINHYMEVSDSIRNRPAGERCPTPPEVGMMYRLLKMIGMVQGWHPGSYMEAYTELLTFINKKNRPLAKEVIPLADQYIKTMLHADKSYDDEVLGEKMEMAMEAIAQEEKEEAERQQAEQTCHPEPAEGHPEPPCHPELVERADIGQVGETWANDGATASPATTTPKPAMEAANEEKPNASLPQCGNEKKSPTDGAICHPKPVEGHPELAEGEPIDGQPIDRTPLPALRSHLCRPEPAEGREPAAGSFTPSEATLDLTLSLGEGRGEASYYATLPPSQRPSPFREGNIIWVNHIDDVNEDDRKMSDSIRYYPDMDPSNNLALASSRFREYLDEQERTEKLKELASRKEKNNRILTMEQYNLYKSHPDFTVANNIYETITINGQARNKMAFHYNMLQMALPEDERILLTDKEFLTHKSLEATFAYMRMEHGHSNNGRSNNGKRW